MRTHSHDAAHATAGKLALLTSAANLGCRERWPGVESGKGVGQVMGVLEALLRGVSFFLQETKDRALF